MTCDMPEPCKFPSLDSYQKRFLWIHRGVDLAPHPVVGLVVQVGDAEEFPSTLGFEGLDLFLRVSKKGPCFIAIEEDGGGIGLFELSETKLITSLRKLPATIDRSFHFRIVSLCLCAITICSFSRRRHPCQK